MPDLEHRLREARSALGEPEIGPTAQAQDAVAQAGAGLRSRRSGRLGSRGRLILALAAIAAVVAAAFAAGFVAAPTKASDAPRVAGPGFLPAAGWATFQTGHTEAPQAPSATAANVELGADVFTGTFPWETVRRLEEGDVLLQSTFYPTGESAAVDEQFPERTLPLSFADAEAGAGLEGQPADVIAYRLLAQVNGQNVDLFVFFGGEPDAETRAAAQDELARLIVPDE